MERREAARNEMRKREGIKVNKMKRCSVEDMLEEKKITEYRRTKREKGGDEEEPGRCDAEKK